MSFVQLKDVCDEFRTLLRAATGRELIDAVSVDEPKEPEDELHFIKLVSWCYVFVLIPGEHGEFAAPHRLGD
jgi:hypothetical protein